MTTDSTPAVPLPSPSAERLRAEPQGDWFYDAEDPENGAPSVYEILDNYAPGEIVEIEGAKMVWRGAGVSLQPAFGSDSDEERFIFGGDADEVEALMCATMIGDLARWLVASPAILAGERA